ncbi:dihydrolipoamide acetyltransferase family protein [Dactylosporangium fulvum]|uniref:Dihydrolipoamide acetyltransferase component of pyruvate dehydrogenase complex n=1 Tax=Dactylosporangium fulvum TaxID=53359 RepID=A0ABY5WBT6_9ACTN|nr:dihydrolipoamide acetyltransferase family protein [Dactylosporangium fulvum]UWP86581.1 2-oxo acid dehydrogenase subunit E2 [Dactylosporangium fulvum]
MSTEQFHLPDVGEGLTEAEIVAWHVAVGDVVEVNQIIVDIETAKSVVELPSPFAGTVTELLVAAGETVAVGTAIIGITTAVSAEEPKLLVGYGARESEGRQRRRGGAVLGAVPAVVPAAEKPRAKPPVRKLAQVLGVDLAAVVPTGPDGIVARADVLGAAENGAAPAAPSPVPDGDVTRYPIKGVRKHTAAAMVASAFTAPHVTEFVTVDVTETIRLKDRVQQRREFRDVKLTPLAFVARAYLIAVGRTPIANGHWDEASQEIVVPAAVNLGIAAATPRGLVVPNIRAAHALGLRELAVAINELAATARAGKTPPERMSGGTTTITNVGVFGVDTGTPILNPGETAILAVGAIRRMPWVVEDERGERIEPRSVLQLALSFDHRVMDGQQGSELLADTAAVLAEPGLAIL